MSKLTIFHSSHSRWTDHLEKTRKMNPPEPSNIPLIFWAESEEALRAKLAQIVFFPHNVVIVADFETSAERLGALVTVPGFRSCPVAAGKAEELIAGCVYFNPGKGVLALSGNRLSITFPGPDNTAEFYRTVLLSSPDVLLVTDAELNITFATPSAARLLGYTPAELATKTFPELIHPEDLSLLSAEFAALSSPDDGFLSAEVRLRHKDGSLPWAESTGIDMRKHPTIRGLIVTLRDISGRHRAGEEARELNVTLVKRATELVESNEELERFAYIASHDLQEPLRMITSFLLLLKKRHSEQVDETAQQYIDFAVDGAERMKKLIRDLLEYSRAGAPHEDFTQVDLNMVLFDVLTLFQNKIITAGARVDVGHLPVVGGRRTQLQQLFQNLVSNALKYRRSEDPLIEIGCAEKGKYWEFFVKDNGIGIDPQHNEKIFVIFQRLHSKSEYSGAGIGLAVCKKIVERHGGQMWVESAPGKGSTFKFTLVR